MTGRPPSSGGPAPLPGAGGLGEGLQGRGAGLPETHESLRSIAASAGVILLAAATILGAGSATLLGQSSAGRLPGSNLRGRITLAPCPDRPAASGALCGTVPVPENRSARGGRKIDLRVVVLPGIGGSVRPPLFSLEGGPGMAASEGAEMWETELASYREKRDIVLLDQRGTGGSNPLRCERETRSAADFLTPMYPADYVRRCRSDLEPRADLTRYTTPNAADDIESVRRALGYGRIDLIGLSYGTRLALVYMRKHPRSVHAAVLMSVTPTWVRLPLFHSANARRALSLLLQDCAAEAPCAAAYPDLAGDLASVAGSLAHAPARTSAAWPAGSAPAPVSIPRDLFFETLRRQLYAPESSRRIPAVIHAAARGDFEPFLNVLLPRGDRRDPIADGLYLSITCSEDTTRITPPEADSATAGSPFGRYRIDQQQAACAMWPVTKMPKSYFRDVRSSIPTLLLSGGRDPVTPPEWATRAAAKLSRSLHVIVPLSAHAPNGLDDVSCWDRVVVSFLDRGTTEGLDTSCLQSLKPAPFDLPR